MTELPEWIATTVGRLYLENEAMRRALEEAQRQPAAAPDTAAQPEAPQ